ncbi:hypothetical protein H8356DRAFT_247921 [Neocallimastix lanati (nom. inval.)]|nr:hypothetical protein H8356DRAFT_247921 [Neocallimastix sp. JGI-2020a]
MTDEKLEVNNIEPNENKENDENKKSNDNDKNFNAINALNLNKYLTSTFNYYCKLTRSNQPSSIYDNIIMLLEQIQFIWFTIDSKLAISYPISFKLFMDILFVNFEIKYWNDIVDIVAWIFLIFFYSLFFIYGPGNTSSLRKTPTFLIKLNILLSKIIFSLFYIPFLNNFINMAVSLIYGRDQVTDSRDANFIIYKNAVTFLLTESIIGSILLYTYSVLVIY